MVKKKDRTRIIIMGALGRDFHNFNMVYRNNPKYEVVAFTKAQIPSQTKLYPKELAGKLYPKGIPIYPEEQLPQLIKNFDVDLVVLAYSDLSHKEVMDKGSIAMANGASFELLGPKQTMLQSKKFVIAVTAVRTGAGKSPTSRKISQILRAKGVNFVVIRHPMPYGDLAKMAVQRFSSKDDLDRWHSTIEEREEYEPHLDVGNIVYAGVDYEKILRQAEREADVILWDGGNNDFSFIRPDLNIVLTDARRPGHEVSYYPGEINLRMADVVIVNKIDSANPADVENVIQNVSTINPRATIIRAGMPVHVDRPELVRGKRVLVIEDGPTLTHGGLNTGAASIAAQNLGAYMVNPRENAVGSIKEIYRKYPHLGTVLPAMGYSKKQIEELQETINKAECDSVLVGTPIDLRHLLNINKPAAKIRYELQEIGTPNLEYVLDKALRKI
jgi:predicted GTPase